MKVPVAVTCRYSSEAAVTRGQSARPGAGVAGAWTRWSTRAIRSSFQDRRWICQVPSAKNNTKNKAVRVPITARNTGDRRRETDPVGLPEPCRAFTPRTVHWQSCEPAIRPGHADSPSQLDRQIREANARYPSVGPGQAYRPGQPDRRDCDASSRHTPVEMANGDHGMLCMFIIESGIIL